jgi:hypothetical protein
MALLAAGGVGLHRNSFNYGCFGLLAGRQNTSFSPSKQVLG